MADDSVGVAAAASPTNYIDNESISTGGSPATVDRQRVRIGGAGYAELADVVTGDTGQNMQIVGPSRKAQSFSVTATGAISFGDVSNYAQVGVHVTDEASGLTARAQISNDNTNWLNIGGVRQDSGASYNLGNPAVAGFFTFSLAGAKYFRLNVSTISSGTFAGVAVFRSVPTPPPSQSVFVEGGNAFSVNPVMLSSATDGASVSSLSQTQTRPYLYNGSTFDRLRVPVIFKTATATASGDTALWTPTSGKKFRLMRYKIEVTADAATSGGADLDIQLRDSTTGLAGAAMSLYVPGTSVTTNPGVFTTGWVDLGNGQLSATANNVLNINLSAALTSGKVRVVACGTEE